jgi:hypothetical protein
MGVYSLILALLWTSHTVSFAGTSEAGPECSHRAVRSAFVDLLYQRGWDEFKSLFAELESKLGMPLGNEQKITIITARKMASHLPGEVLPTLREVFTEEQAFEILEHAVFRNNPDRRWRNFDQMISRASVYDRDIEGVVERGDWLKWRYNDVLEHRGKVLKYQMASTDVKLSQRVLVADDFSSDEQGLIAKLIRESKNKKYVRRDEALQEKIRRDPSIRPDDQDVVDRLRRLVPGKSVEVGEWRVELNDGSVIKAKITSSLLREIKGDDVFEAYNAAMAKHGVRPSQVRSIQFFHIHPVPGAPLSNGDHETLLQFRAHISFRLNPPSVNVYAISEVEGKPVIYQIGF